MGLQRRSGAADWRPRRRRSALRSSRTYSLADLLSRQPKTLQKQRGFALLEVQLGASVELRRVRLNSRCFALLHHARIRPESLENLHQTYRLPRHPFYPQFLKLKRDYINAREQQQEARRRYILVRMRLLPQPIVEFVRYLGYLEVHFNAVGGHPLWDRHLFPSSKKQVHEYAAYGQRQWLALFRRHMDLLCGRYAGFTPGSAEQLLAGWVLECGSYAIPPVRPAAALVKRRYRELSLRHHPDQGGDPLRFLELKQARDLLLR